jgi:Mono-functional DNA-alkylating methyl methanesulfonate N-term
LLVANAGVTSLLLYRWDSRYELSNAKPLRCSGQNLPVEDAFPLMLIPSSKSTSFIIVTETALVIYDNILSTEAKRISFHLPKQTPASYENSSGPPLWVQWAKPHRSSPQYQNHDDFFLVREDGELRYYILNHKSPLKVEAHFSLGNLGINVDSAFTILAGPPTTGGDIFIIGGDMTDGGVYHCLPRASPRLTQVIPNMSPTQDMLSISAVDLSDSKALYRPARAERTFTCSGKGSGHCYINELRFGIEAQLGWTIENPDSRSMTRLWALEDSNDNRLLLIASHPLQTTVVAFQLPSLEVEAANSDSCPGLDLDSATLAMASIAKDVFVQITQHGVNVTSFSSGFTPIAIPLEPLKILTACIDARNGLLLIAVQTSIDFELRLGEMTRGNDQSYIVGFAGTPHLLSDEPIALCLSSLANASILAVSTNTGLLHIFLTDSIRGLKLISSKKFVDLVPGAGQASASSLQILSDRNSPYGILLCGFRNGKLGCLSLCLEIGSSPTLRKFSADLFEYVDKLLIAWSLRYWM